MMMVLWMSGSLLGCQEESTAPGPEPEATPSPAPAPEPTPNPAQEPQARLPKTPASFDAAVATATELWKDHRRTFFCGCMYTTEGRIARGSCGYQTRADESLAKHVRWERVVPARSFGAARACWSGKGCQDGADASSGVQCCAATDPVFGAMYADLHNIAPVVAEIAQDRSNYGFGDIEGETRLYGSCDFEVDRAAGVAEPGDRARGAIARAYLYMNATYPEALDLSKDELAMFQAWHEADPPSEWEIERNARIAAIQGVANPFVPLGKATKRVAVLDTESTKPQVATSKPKDEAKDAPEAEGELTAREAIFKVGRAAPSSAGTHTPGAGAP